MSNDLIYRNEATKKLREYAESQFTNNKAEEAVGILKAVNFIESGKIYSMDIDMVKGQLLSEAIAEDIPIYEEGKETDYHIRLSKVVEIIDAEIKALG